MRNFSLSVATLLALTAIFTSPLWAGEQEAVITRLEGRVHILHSPSKTLPEHAPAGENRVKYENGMHYLAASAKLGDTIGNGHFLRTEPNARAQVTYPNGDQITVAPGTMYEVKWAKDTARADQAKVQMNLLWGKMRGVVAKGGPRSKLMIRTRSATMGVRGTDFFIAAEGKSGETEITTLRGEVEVTPTTGEAKPVAVKVSQSVAVTQAAAEIRKTTQEDLKAIQTVSEVKKVIAEEKAVSAEIDQKVAALETKAAETALQDIAKTEPELYAKMQATGKSMSPQEIHQQTVDHLLKTAPVAPPKRKPFRSELDDLEQGTYQKYFKQDR